MTLPYSQTGRKSTFRKGSSRTFNTCLMLSSCYLPVVQKLVKLLLSFSSMFHCRDFESEIQRESVSEVEIKLLPCYIYTYRSGFCFCQAVLYMRVLPPRSLLTITSQPALPIKSPNQSIRLDAAAQIIRCPAEYFLRVQACQKYFVSLSLTCQ